MRVLTIQMILTWLSIFLFGQVMAQQNLKPVVFYLQNLPHERLGTDSDATIIDSLESQNFLVVTVDCSEFPRESPALEERLIAFHKTTPTLLATYADASSEPDLDNIYYVPEGYMLKPNIPIWNIIDHGADGSIERILSTWNKEIVEKHGVDPVENYQEMYDKQGNPIDYNMYMDLIYPSGTSSVQVPLVLNFTSNSPRQKPFNPSNSDEVVYRSIFPLGFLITGYAWANVDHCYNPLAKTEVWSYFDRYSLEDWNGLALARAYIRYLNMHQANYNLNGKYGTMGLSKASYSSMRISNTQNADEREHFLFNGVENTKEQPWLGYPSTVEVAYAAAGNGTRRANQYVNEFTVPMITSAGSKDQYNQWDVYPEVVRKFQDEDKIHLALWMEELGHTYPGMGVDVATGENRYVLFKRFFDHYLKSKNTDPLHVFSIYPKEDANEVDTKGYSRILVHDGVLPTAMLGVSAYAPISVRFLSEVDILEIENHVQVIHKASQTLISGEWRASMESTNFEFILTDNLEENETYQIKISSSLKNTKHQFVDSEVIREFTVTKPSGDDVDTKNKRIYPTDDTYQKTSLGTTHYGSEETIRVRYSPYGDWRFDGYLKFDITDLKPTRIQSASLKLSSSSVLTGDPIALSVYKTDTNWVEGNLLSANKPTILSTALDMVSFTGNELWTEFDITNQLKADLLDAATVLSLMIRAATGGSTENIYFNSKEIANEELRPYLSIDEIESPSSVLTQLVDAKVIFNANQLEVVTTTPVQINIYHISGKMMRQQTVIDHTFMDMSAFDHGVYIVVLQTDKDIYQSLKIVL